MGSNPVYEKMIFVLGPNVDSSCRLVEDQYFALCGEPFRKDHLLLVASGKVLYLPVEVRGLDIELLFALFPLILISHKLLYLLQSELQDLQ